MPWFYLSMKSIIFENKIQDILSIYNELSKERSFFPTPKINLLFNKIILIINKTNSNDSDCILRDKRILAIKGDLQKISAVAESELELLWAQKIIANNFPLQEIKKFPYYQNYQKLVNYEISEITQCSLHNTHEILFVGSGPLPLSAILFSKINLNIHCIDSNLKAVDISRKLVHKISANHLIRCSHKNIYEIKDFSGYQVIFLASLVGNDNSEKIDIINHITQYAKEETHIVLRDADGLVELIYPAINQNKLKKIKIIKKIQAPEGVINSIIISKVI